jgi:small subunit ribosomal protein S21
MLKVNIKKGNIERALKELKSKFIKTKVARECRDRKEFTKPSVTRRDEINKAKYVQKKKTDEDN